MTTAIFGLIGVIVGVVVTGAVDMFMAWRQGQGVVFKAKRLVAEELQLIYANIFGMLQANQTFGPLPESGAEFMPTTAWNTYKETLAQKGVMSDKQWRTLATCYQGLVAVRGMCLVTPPATELWPEMVENLKFQRAVVEDLSTRRRYWPCCVRLPSPRVH